jgi:hypothetical protein
MSDQTSHKLLICDNLNDQVAGDPRFIAWYIKKSHHMLVNIIFTVQNLFQHGLRTIRAKHQLAVKSLSMVNMTLQLSVQFNKEM